MKTLVTNYTFDASAKTVTFSDYTTILLESVLLITNVTDNIIIYNFASTGGSVATNVLTLDYDTTSMSDTDDLQIFYEDTSEGLADIKYGTATSVAQLATTTIVSYVAVAGDKFYGFSATGTRSGLFRLKVAGSTKLAGRVAPGTETVVNHMPVPQTLSTGVTILLEVTNEGQGSGDFEGSIIIA